MVKLWLRLLSAVVLFQRLSTCPKSRISLRLGQGQPAKSRREPTVSEQSSTILGLVVKYNAIHISSPSVS